MKKVRWLHCWIVGPGRTARLDLVGGWEKEKERREGRERKRGWAQLGSAFFVSFSFSLVYFLVFASDKKDNKIN